MEEYLKTNAFMNDPVHVISHARIWDNLHYRLSIYASFQTVRKSVQFHAYDRIQNQPYSSKLPIFWAALLWWWIPNKTFCLADRSSAFLHIGLLVDHLRQQYNLQLSVHCQHLPSQRKPCFVPRLPFWQQLWISCKCFMHNWRPKWSATQAKGTRKCDARSWLR